MSSERGFGIGIGRVRTSGESDCGIRMSNSRTVDSRRISGEQSRQIGDKERGRLVSGCGEGRNSKMEDEPPPWMYTKTGTVGVREFGISASHKRKGKGVLPRIHVLGSECKGNTHTCCLSSRSQARRCSR